MSGPDRRTGHPECGHDAAPYVLGALDPDEARSFVRHMTRCAVCRDEVAGLAPVLGALPASAPAHAVTRALRRRVLRAVRARPKVTAARRPWGIRPVGSLAPAGWLALGGAVVAAIAVQLAPAGPNERTIHATVGQAQLRVADSHGELVADRLPPLPPNRTYELWLQRGSRGLVPSTLFGVTARGSADLGVPGDLHGVSRLLVTVEPRGGSVHPTTRAVIQVPLAYVSRS
jgi:anti-sigma-K factor RskA